VAGAGIPAYASLVIEGLHRAGIRIVAALPDSLFKTVHVRLRQDRRFTYVLGASEADLPGIAAGAYLGGKRAALLMENSGIRQACEPIARFAFSHHMPLLMLITHRGDLGERYWWGHSHAQTMDPLLAALRIPSWPVRRLEAIKTSISRAATHTETSQWPVALVFSGECVESGKG